jgi:putative membrane protein
MGINTQQSLKAMILGLFALFFLKLHLTGDIGKYINPKYDFMSKIAIGFFF